MGTSLLEEARTDQPKGFTEGTRSRSVERNGRDRWRRLGISTRAVHAGSQDDPVTGAVGTPIYQTSTFLLGQGQYQAVGEGKGREILIYSRWGNPSQWAVQEKLAALEGAESAVVTSSGMAAIHAAVTSMVEQGDHVVASNELYGGTFSLFQHDLPRFGVEVTFVDPRDLDAVARAMGPRTRLLYFEALSNPLLKLADIPSLAAIARRHEAKLVVDATFVTPLGCRPLEHGADLVVHSGTKYLNGHSDLMCGAVLGGRELVDEAWRRLIHQGSCLDPHGCFLLERGLKTLSLRMRAHWQGALEVARFLRSRPEIDRVFHPDLNDHPDHALAERLLDGGCGMVTFFVRGGDEAALALLGGLRIPKEATSLGGVESLISLPFNSSHATYSAEERSALGLDPGCIRLSVGVEDPVDLIDDFDQSLSRLASSGPRKLNPDRRM